MILDRLSKREKILSIATITVVIIGFSYALILEPLTNKWKTLNTQIEQKALRLYKNRRILRKENRIREEFEKYAEHTRSIGTDEEAVAILLKAIEQRARKTATHIINIRPRRAKDMGFYKEFVFDVISESSLGELLKFVYELQNSKELLKVKKLTLSLKSGQPKTLRSVMEIIKVSIK